MFYLFVVRGEEGGRQRGKETLMYERNISPLELIVSCMPPTGDLALKPGMCPDWESNQQPSFCRTMANPLSLTSQGAHQRLFKITGKTVCVVAYAEDYCFEESEPIQLSDRNINSQCFHPTFTCFKIFSCNIAFLPP